MSPELCGLTPSDLERPRRRTLREGDGNDSPDEDEKVKEHTETRECAGERKAI